MLSPNIQTTEVMVEKNRPAYFSLSSLLMERNWQMFMRRTRTH